MRIPSNFSTTHKGTLRCTGLIFEARNARQFGINAANREEERLLIVEDDDGQKTITAIDDGCLVPPTVLEHWANTSRACLLYTSPSPRD